jgi:hypothetical protein
VPDGTAALQRLFEFLVRHFAVNQDLAQQARSDVFARMDWHDRGAAVWMTHEMVTATDADNFKSRLLV